MEQFKEFDDYETFLKYGLEFDLSDLHAEGMFVAMNAMKRLRGLAEEQLESSQYAADDPMRPALEKCRQIAEGHIAEYGPLTERLEAGLQNVERARQDRENT